MRQYTEIEAMVKQAEAQRSNAMDLRLLGAIDYDTTASRVGFANGVEAALLWVMGHLGDIGFAPIKGDQ
jgi:hypothetical protein